MLRNYLKIAWRSLLRQKGFSLINILGLAVGLTASLFIYLFVTDEWSYDHHHEHAADIHRVYLSRVYPHTTVNWASIAPAVGPTLGREFPEVEAVTRLSKGEQTVSIGDRKFVEEGLVYADSAFFEVFSVPIVKGNVGKWQPKDRHVLLTEETASRYFGDRDPVGQVIAFRDTILFTVMGVVENVPNQSHFTYDMLLPIYAMREPPPNTWGTAFQFFTYVRLQKGTSIRAFEEKMVEMSRTYLAADFGDEKEYQSWRASGNDYVFLTQPLRDIHLTSAHRWEFQANGDRRYVYLFSLIAFFILLIACINFVNLSTARATRRAREVGVRKVLGSLRYQLISQFLTESVLMSLVAMFIALQMTQLLMPFFEELAGKQFEQSTFLQLGYLWKLVAFTVGLGLIAGVYPAFVLSSFRPVQVLKGKLFTKRSAFNPRDLLVVTQFVISLVLIAGTAVVYQQMDFMQKKKLGFNQDQLLVIDHTAALRPQAKPFKEEILALPSVTNVAYVGQAMGEMKGATTYFPLEEGENRGVNVTFMFGDLDAIQTYGITLTQGRSFRPTDLSDTTLRVMLNETAARQLGLGDSAAGQFVLNLRHQRAQVIGVMKDFHFESLHHAVRPLVMRCSETWLGKAVLRVTPNNLSETVAQVQQIWEKHLPGRSFSYSFLDQDLEALYLKEKRTASSFMIFAGLAIFVACLGLFGLVAYMVERRIREISIRKVLGASAHQIAILLSSHYLKLVIFAILLATPIAWYCMYRWLENFAYRTVLSWEVFGLAGLMALMIAILTISYQALKAAHTNPVEWLKDE